jgi:5-formyltetrahydrofolate cyclo-ligase
MSEERAMAGWDEIRRWRRERRAELIARRQAMPQAERRRLQPLILDRVEREFPELAGALVGFYWPIRGEIGAIDLIRRLLERGARAALPVVVEKGRPLEFRAWRPGDRLERGVWNIPIPAKGEVVRPAALLVPLVGFDAAGYRLGYGGGYYDRTLAALDPKPLAIGLGFELGRLATIHPQTHDIPMDAIVTEAGTMRARAGRPAANAFAAIDEDPNSRATYASPPCFMHELDPAYLGFAPEDRPDEGASDATEEKGGA